MAEFFLSIPPPRVTHQQKKVAVVHGKKVWRGIPGIFVKAEEICNG